MRDSRDRADPLDFPSQSFAGHRWSWWQWCCVEGPSFPRVPQPAGRTSWWRNPRHTEMVKSVHSYHSLILENVLLCCFTQSCLTLLQPHGLCGPWSSFIHGIFMVRILEWVNISFSRRLLNSGIKPVLPSLHLCLLHYRRILLQLNH